MPTNPKNLKFTPNPEHVQHYCKNFNKEKAKSLSHTQMEWSCTNIPYFNAIKQQKFVEAQMALDKIALALANKETFIELRTASSLIIDNPHYGCHIVELLNKENLKIVFYTGINDTPMGEEPWSMYVITPLNTK